MKLKTGIIGCGKVGDFHAKAYAQLENSEFTAVCDANLERAKAFAERYNVHAYSDIAEMIQKEHLDVVSVCTPHPIHCDPAVTAAENGCNVLIEKPLASSLADCDRIIEAGDKNHVTIGTMVQRRFYRPCMRIHVFNLRLQHATNQLDNPIRIAQVKKDIARVKTIIREQQLAGR